jgi:hypothetical protein
MKDEAEMLRIAISALALTMIGVPVLAASFSGAPMGREAVAAEQMVIALSQDEVLALARTKGMARLTEVAFENDVWQLTGETRGGFPMALHISSTGEILTHTS